MLPLLLWSPPWRSVTELKSVRAHMFVCVWACVPLSPWADGRGSVSCSALRPSLTWLNNQCSGCEWHRQRGGERVSSTYTHKCFNSSTLKTWITRAISKALGRCWKRPGCAHYLKKTTLLLVCTTIAIVRMQRQSIVLGGGACFAHGDVEPWY